MNEKTYSNIRLYDEIKTEMQSVIEAEENSKAWKIIARERMRDVNTLIAAARKVNKDENGNPIEIDTTALVKEIREELTPVEDTEETEADTDTTEEETAE